MDTHLHHNTTKEAIAEYKNPREEADKLKTEQSPPPSSSSSSPSHEFSFTISLQSLSSPKPNPNDKTSKTHQPPFAIDLSPADEIFFHGHLLPLHLLSHLPVSPRASTNSVEGFTFPVRDVAENEKTQQNNVTDRSVIKDKHNKEKIETNVENRVKSKPKSFSLFGLAKWRKGFEHKGVEFEEEKEKQKKKMMSLDLSHALKKYMRMLFQKRENGTEFRRQAYSFSSANIMSSTTKNNNDSYKRGRRRGEFSAPASMRTSPTNSGHLLVKTGVSSSSCSSTSDSTMEELQAAIQAAIAHCKNSIAVEDKAQMLEK